MLQALTILAATWVIALFASGVIAIGVLISTLF